MKGLLFVAFARSLLLTLVLESAFFWITGKRSKNDLLLLALVNLLTNPLVLLFYWLNLLYAQWNGVIVSILLELFAIALEGYYYKTHGEEFRRPYAFSLAANGFSFGVGLLLLTWLS